MAFTFHKSERLCSKKLIARLFVKGNRGFSRFPFRFTWVEAPLESSYPAQVLFIVSKKNHAHATARNRIKRMMREMYRLSKPALYDTLRQHNKQIALSVSYLLPANGDQKELAELFSVCIKQLCHEITRTIHPADQSL